MDELSRAFYEMKYELCFVKKNGSEFQDFFADIMARRYQRDFIRVRPWGNAGDRKCDGYLSSRRALFQVFAPNEARADVTVAKIEEDFSEALPYWHQYFDTWVFVHNSRNGLGPQVTSKLLELKRRNPKITVEHESFDELRKRLFELPDSDIAALLGAAPSHRAMLRVGYQELRVVLDVIVRQPALLPAQIRPVPSDKIERNSLSPNVATMLKAGTAKADHVGQFFSRYPRPTYGDEIARVFRAKYQELKSQPLTPDEIFQELTVFAGGALRGAPEHECAVLAVLAYLFEKCEIFEPAGEAHP